MSLQPFYFPDPSAFLIPVEHLSPAGLDDAYWALLSAEHGLQPAWRERFDAAYARYWERSSAAFQRAPQHWLPPRACNLLVVRDPQAAHPYQRPMFNSALLLYASDFEPEEGSVELAAFLLLQQERLQVMENLAQTLLVNLSGLLLLDDAQAEDFAAGCRRCTRPDRAGYQALGEALGWIRRLYHASLRPPQLVGTEVGELGQTGLLVPPELQPRIGPLLEAFAGGAQRAVEEHYQHYQAGAQPAPLQELVGWLREAVPQVIVVDPHGRALWDPEQPAATGQLEAALGPLHERVAAAIRADLEVIDARSRGFLEALVDPGALPLPTLDEVDQSDGVYLQKGRHLLAYSLQQPAWKPPGEPTPPLVRLLVAARTIHEWGHLAEAGQLVRPRDEQALRQARAGLEQAFAALLRAVPPQFQGIVLRETEGQASPAQAATERTLARLPDYLANLLANHFLQPAELEAYVRLNVRSHMGEPLGPVGQLAQHALELQYMRFSQLEPEPGRDYALRITQARDSLVGSGFTSQTLLDGVLAAASAVCDVYEVDASKFEQLPPPSVQR